MIYDGFMIVTQDRSRVKNKSYSKQPLHVGRIWMSRNAFFARTGIFHRLWLILSPFQYKTSSKLSLEYWFSFNVTFKQSPARLIAFSLVVCLFTKLFSLGHSYISQIQLSIIYDKFAVVNNKAFLFVVFIFPFIEKRNKKKKSAAKIITKLNHQIYWFLLWLFLFLMRCARRFT